MPGCVEEAEKTILEGWEAERSASRSSTTSTVEAFATQTDAWFRDNLEGESLAVYEAIRNSAP